MLKNIFRRKELINHEEQLAEWEKNGRPSPPPHIVKQKTIDEFRKKFNAGILVETGTYLGDMIEAQRNNFKKIYSIELSEKLFHKAVKRFKAYPHIKILQGDSGLILNNLMPDIDNVSIFWLDGHYSGGMTAMGSKECPVPEELEIIIKSSLNHIILIDDARLFNGTHDYPTLEQISDIINKSGKNFTLDVKNDIIEIILK